MTASGTRVAVDDGVELNCLEWLPEQSEATPVLLVHGLASNAQLWSGVAARLCSHGHPVVAVDQRGHGRSSKPPDGYDFNTLTEDLTAVIAHYGWTGNSRPYVAGQSWGANVVLELGARHPDTVAGIALVDGGMWDLADRFADWPSCEAALAPPPLEGTPADRFEEFVRRGHPDWPEDGILATLQNVEFLPDGTVRPWLARSSHMKILRHLWEHRPSEAFASVNVPALLIPADDPSNQRWASGKRDQVERAAKAIPVAVAVPLVGDHDLHAQHPDRIAELIDAATRPGFFR